MQPSVLRPLALFLGLSAALFAADPAKVAITGKGHRFLAADYEKKVIAIVGADGAIEWKKQMNHGPHDAWMLDNGNLLYPVSNTRIVEYDIKADKEVWSYDSGKMNGNEGKPVEVHAFQPLPDGGLVIFESGPCRIIEIDRAGTLLKEVPMTVAKRDAHRDTRNARKLASGNYLVAHESDACIREYDGTGKVVWEHPVGSKVYGVLRLANGNTLINTGDGHRVVEVDKDHKEVWAVGQKDLPGITLGWLTQVSRLPNGNTIIVNCHGGPQNPQLIEITPDKQVAWSWRDFETFGNALPIAIILDAPAGTLR